MWILNLPSSLILKTCMHIITFTKYVWDFFKHKTNNKCKLLYHLSLGFTVNVWHWTSATTAICMGSALVCHDHRSVVSPTSGHLVRVRASPDADALSKDALLQDSPSTTSSEFKECWIEPAVQSPVVTEQNVELVTGGYCEKSVFHALFHDQQGMESLNNNTPHDIKVILPLLLHKWAGNV